MTQLGRYIQKFGKVLEVGTRAFTVDGIAEDGDIKVATFKGPRASYTGVVSVNGKVAGKPGAEVWSVIGGKRVVARFAVHDNTIVVLA